MITVHRIIGVLVLLVMVSGCTIRYSKTGAEDSAAATGTTVSKHSTGLEIFAITVNDPTPARDLIAAVRTENNCKNLSNIEVDYRNLYIIIVGIPRVTVTGTCVK